MLKDRIFYPIALALIAAMIWFALSRSTVTKLSDACIWQNGFVTQGEDLVTLTASPGTSYEYVGATPTDPAHIVTMTQIPRKDAPASAGVFAALGPDYERAFAGQQIRVTVRARQGRKAPLEAFDMGYFTAGAGDSRWQRRRLTQDWQDFTLDFAPKPPNGDPDLDYMGVWPGDQGEQKTMDVAFMKIDVLSKPASASKDCPGA
jgi:hypothetical protein